jgi:hypothetical protein
MKTEPTHIKILLSHIKPGLELEIKGENNTLFEISDEDVVKYGEAKIQLKEGCSYEYQFSDSTIYFKDKVDSQKNVIITCSKFDKSISFFEGEITV